jgi:alpha-L-rhamnosidase
VHLHAASARWMIQWSTLLGVCLSGALPACGQALPQSQEARTRWTAEWISDPSAPLREPAVFHFRKEINLATQPRHFIVKVSADNRFVLYVNGIRIGDGPARGDLLHWRYETFDLASALHAGENSIGATVWNFGIYAPLAQISNRTAFLMQGDTEAESSVDTDGSWQVETEPGFTFIPRKANGFWFYWAADPGEHLDGHRYDWDWRSDRTSSTSHWLAAAGAIRESIYPQTSRPSPPDATPANPWMLTPDTLPPMEYAAAPVGEVVRTNLPAANAFPAAPVVVAPHSLVEILLDRRTMITGYPQLVVSGGGDAQIEIGYTEALYDKNQLRGNRNEVGDREVLGLFDEFLPDGGQRRVFEPLWWRTWRYLQLTIKTDDAPLTLERLSAHFSAYPFREEARFASSDPELERIWEICWRTARLGAHETYMDTPFWEQLQYVDDTRIQALISYTIAGDDRLAVQALRAFDASRVPEGLTQSRYPSSLPQFIPNFSLSYIDMLHDYWMYRPDREVLRDLLPGTRSILEWFFRRQRADGFLEKLPYWVAIDSPRGIDDFPRIDRVGRSALVTLLFVEALQDAADLEDALGDKSLAVRYRRAAGRDSAVVYRACWDARVNLLADTPDKNSYSQHTNIHGVLTGAIPEAKQKLVVEKLLATHSGERLGDADVAMASIHYQYYLSRAIDKVGGDYLVTLTPWHRMLALGLTTTPEYEDPTRSDTHAWSAHPIYDLLTIVAGIHPATPGFTAVRIEPHPGTLNHFDASMPHPQGTIRVRFEHWADRDQFTVDLPPSLNGSLNWNGQSYPLHGGNQKVTVPDTAIPSPEKER